MSERKESRLATPFVAAVAIAGMAALAYGLRELPQRVDIPMVLTLVASAAFAQRAPVFLFRSSSISVAFAATIATYVLYGPGLALWVNLGSALVNSVTPRPKPARKIIFNLGSFTVAAFVAGHLYVPLAGSGLPDDILRAVVAVLISSSAYFVCGSVLTATIVGLTTGTPFATVWRANYGWMPIHYLATAANGAALALAYQSLGLFGTLTFVVPLVVAWYSLHLYVTRSAEIRRRVDELTEAHRRLQMSHDQLEQSRLGAIARLLGELTSQAPDLGRLAAAYPAIAVARDMGLPDDEVSAVFLGGMLRDIGNLVVPEDAPNNAGELTAEEWEQIRGHPVRGAELVARVAPLQNVRPVILSHHERYDGTGYPAGLVGEQIPLGARIVAVADAYESMTSARPYRPARSMDDAIAELRAAAGTQLDPIIVERFVAALGGRSDAPA